MTKPTGSSNRAVKQQASAAAKNTSNQQATTAEQVSNQQGLVPPTTKKILPARTCSPRKPAVTVELAEEEGDQTPYFNPFQK